MRDDLLAALDALIAKSLAQWRCEPVSRGLRSSDGALTLRSDQHIITVERAAEGLPFRWIVHIDDHRRVAASVVGVLRIVRQTVTTSYRPGHVTIAPLPPAPQ